MSKLGVDRESVSTLSAKASLEPTRFNAQERSQYIQENVNQIIRMNKEGRSKEDIKTIFPEFVEQYPGLFEMILRPEGFDTKTLSFMIQMLGNMANGKASQHEASIQVGQHVLDTYVKPQLN